MRRIDLRRDDGVAMTEFALILPVFVLIIVGILSFGRVFFYWIEANHLANETARWAVVDKNPYAPTSLQDGGARLLVQGVPAGRQGLHRLPDGGTSASATRCASRCRSRSRSSRS